MNRFDAVIFDLDGTLADTFPLVLGAFNFAVGPRLNREYTLEELQQYFGPPEIDILRRLFPLPADQQAAIESYHKFNKERGDMIVRIPGMRQLLLKLKARGIHLAVYTGAGHQAGADRVDHIGLSDLFEIVLGGDEVTRHKPDPEGIIKILDRLGVNANRAAFVGDAPADITAGRAAEVTSVAVTWGATAREKLESSSPDSICDSIGCLEEILLQGTR